MSRKKVLLTGILCMALWLTAGSAWAAQHTGVIHNSQTDIEAGVVVDYMGKLRFEVYKRGSTTPIEGASVELYIPSRDKYVLLGLTDANGAFELDVSYTSANLEDQFQTASGTLEFKGNWLYLNSNEIQYQIYKSGWKPYPYQGTETLKGGQNAQVITVYLYQNSSGGSGGGGGSSSSSGGSAQNPLTELFDDKPPLAGLETGENAGGIPKTGVEGAISYWLAGLACFLLAGGILMMIWKKDEGIKKRERGYRDEKSA